MSNQEEPAIMPVNELQHVRIAVVSDSLQQRSYLNRTLKFSGLDVVLCEPLSRLFLKELAGSHAEVLLLDVHNESREQEALLDELLETTEVPIIYNDVSGLTLNEPRVLDKWFGQLMQKIVLLTGRDIKGEPPLDRGDDSLIDELPAPLLDGQAKLAKNVWVLGASLGGPEMVKRFFKALPCNLPVAFILAQHLGANFVSLMAKQLDQVSDYRVMTAKNGHVLRHGEVVIAPVDHQVRINPIGAIELTKIDSPGIYSPSIDQVLADTAKRYGRRSGAIIFSGMGDDGRRACRRMVEHGAPVWVQESYSCIVSAMPDAVAQTGVSSFTGDPEALARQLAQTLRAAPFMEN